MQNNRITLLIIVSFIIGTSLLIFVQYNYSHSMHKLISGNAQLLQEVKATNELREVERDIMWLESKIRGAIATGDTSHIGGMDGKIVEIRGYLDMLEKTNHDPAALPSIIRLRELTEDKIRNRNRLYADFAKTGRMNELQLIANPQARIISNEITQVTKRIYLSRQHQAIVLSNIIAANGRKARLYGYILLGLIILSGASLCYLIINRIRKQNQLIAELDASEKRAREAANVKENFLANMSHEIRTPLTSILGFTNLLKKNNLDKDSNDFVDAIQKASENLLTIVNDILDLSKIEAGMMRIVSEPFSIRGLVDSIHTLFTDKARRKQLAFTFQIEDNIPDTLLGDATRLTQILVNLINNALKFTEKGFISVQLYNAGIHNNTIDLGFKIIDTGIGIDKKKLSEVFDRFTQAEDSITRNYGGTGLGLSIVNNLIRLQNGSINVQSEPARGTTFEFHLTYLIASEQVANKSVNIPLNRDFARFSEKRILVVDDNEMNRSLMKHLLSQWKFAFDIVESGFEAIERLRVTKYDLVLMDIQMPELDGYSTTSEIRSVLKLNLPIIAMTAHALAGEREKCMSNGMNEYISKPINENTLFGILNKFTQANASTASKEKPSAVNGQMDVVDLTYMRSISKGNLAYEKTATRQFIDVTPKYIEKLQEAVKNGDLKNLKRAAHELKTCVSIMGLLPILKEKLDFIEDSEMIDNNTDATVNFVADTCQKAILEAKFYDNHFLASNEE